MHDCNFSYCKFETLFASIFCIFDFKTGCSRNCGYFFTNQVGLLIFENLFQQEEKTREGYQHLRVQTE